MSKVLVRAVELGCKYDEWREYFSFDRWMEAFEKEGVDPHFYANRTIPEDEVLPWDHIDSGTRKGYLFRERTHSRTAAAERKARAEGRASAESSHTHVKEAR